MLSSFEDDEDILAIDINSMNAEILNDEIRTMQQGSIDDVIAASKTNKWVFSRHCKYG